MSDPLTALKTAVAKRFAIEREVGRGGMATVYLAEDLRHHRPVALKVLHPHLAQSLGPDRFLREIEIAARLQHPNIVPLYDSGGVGEQLYYVMPFVEGESLRQRLERQPQLSLEDAVQIARAVAAALDYAHRKGVVHRDIKPENVMLHEGQAVVTDFGIAKAVSAAAADNLTQTGTTVGTPAYMSPEQAGGEEELDGRSDVFSLGSVLYEMLAGERPFTGPTTQAIIAKLFTAPVPPLRERREDVPDWMEAALLKALAKQPADRYATAAELAHCLAAPSSGATPPEVPASAAGAKSIVVLPFTNLSPDAENEYFSDGLTEEVIGDLAKVAALSVISRTSAMQLKGTNKDVRTIGRELGVRYVLEGSVRKAGTSLRITAQLIDALTDEHLWAEKYNGTVEDVFDLQERVSREIVGALDVTLTSDEDRRLADRPIADVRAFGLYLQARQELRRYATEKASKLLEEAIEIEGETPPLRALRAWAKVSQVRAGLNRDRQPLDEAEVEAHALLELAPDEPYGHALLGYIEYERGHQPQAVQHLLAALDREPNDADALFFLGVSYMAAGQMDQAAATGRKIIACDPLAAVAWALLGVAPWFDGRIEESPTYLRRSLEIDPENFIVRWTIGYAHASLGQVSEAAPHATWLDERAPEAPYTVQLLSLLDALSGKQERALERLARIDVEPLDAHNKFHLAESFAMADATEEALGLLERAIDEGFYPYQFLAEYCPFMEPLRGTPRFTDILAKAHRRVEEFKKWV
jgi:serine/threonine protein kinase/Flp pilus assembly protein TadD